MKKTLNLGTYTFTNTDGAISFVNNESGAQGQPSAKGKIKIKLEGEIKEYTTEEVLAMDGWIDEPATDATPLATIEAPEKTIYQLQAEYDTAMTTNTTAQTPETLSALADAAQALKDAKNEASIEAIRTSIQATKDRNNAALAPLQTALSDAKKAWAEAASLDTADMDTLAPLLVAVKTATTALNAYVPEVDENEEKISDAIEANETEIERLKTENKDLKKMLGIATGKKAGSGERKQSESTAWSELPTETKNSIRTAIIEIAAKTTKTTDGKNDNAKIAEILVAQYAADISITEALQAAIPTKLVWVTLNKKAKAVTTA